VLAFPLAYLVKEESEVNLPPDQPPLKLRRSAEASATAEGGRHQNDFGSAASASSTRVASASSTPVASAFRRKEPVAPITHVFRAPAFYLLAIGSMCSIAAVGGTNQHLKLFLSLDQHYTQSAALSVASTVLTFSIFGRLFMGGLADTLPKKHVMLLIYLLIAVSIPLLFVAHNQTAVYAFAAVFGLGLGGEYLIIPLMAAEIFGVKVLGRLMGVVLTADGVAEAVAPMGVGYLRDATGSYRTGFIVLIGIALVGALAISALPRRIEEPARSAQL